MTEGPERETMKKKELGGHYTAERKAFHESFAVPQQQHRPVQKWSWRANRGGGGFLICRENCRFPRVAPPPPATLAPAVAVPTTVRFPSRHHTPRVPPLPDKCAVALLVASRQSSTKEISYVRSSHSRDSVAGHVAAAAAHLLSLYYKPRDTHPGYSRRGNEEHGWGRGVKRNTEASKPKRKERKSWRAWRAILRRTGDAIFLFNIFFVNLYFFLFFAKVKQTHRTCNFFFFF